MEAVFAVESLAQALREDRLVVLVGAAASASTRDERGREYLGLPTPAEFVESVAHQLRYVTAGMAFEAACDTIYQHQRRAGLEDLLCQRYHVPTNFEIPPAHRILSWLPCSAFVTSNYDQFIERALEQERRRHFVIIENTDVPRLKRGYTPVIKYHGCVSRPRTMVATAADLTAARSERRLVQQLIAVTLANRTLLVIGHGLSDEDLREHVEELVGQLDEYAPTIVVLREPGSADKVTNLSFRHEVVHEDLTQFLNRLLHAYRQAGLDADARFFEEAWLSSAFFATLRQAAVLPSETQVIDAFLHHLVDELGARNEVDSVLADAGSAVDGALTERPNYAALRRTWAALADMFADVGSDVAAAEEVVQRLIDAREAKKALFRAIGRDVVQGNDRILIYSQSQRVLQTLQGAPQATQRTCEVFVAECRPKSPAPYQDASAICQSLADSYYAITVCPDVVAINMISNHQITKIIMGTHAIYVDEKQQPYAFVNTCGSLAVMVAAERYNVPLVVIGEQIKVEPVPRAEARDHLFPHQEQDLLEGAVVGLAELRTRRAPIAHTNIGYDLVPIGPLTTVRVPDDPLLSQPAKE